VLEQRGRNIRARLRTAPPSSRGGGGSLEPFPRDGGSSQPSRAGASADDAGSDAGGDVGSRPGSARASQWLQGATSRGKRLPSAARKAAAPGLVRRLTATLNMMTSHLTRADLERAAVVVPPPLRPAPSPAASPRPRLCARRLLLRPKMAPASDGGPGARLTARRQSALETHDKVARRRAAHSAARAAHRARQAERQAEIISFNTEEKKVRLIFVLRFRK